jgi:hypothetical protein
MYGICTVFLAGNSPNIRSYTVHIYNLANPTPNASTMTGKSIFLWWSCSGIFINLGDLSTALMNTQICWKRWIQASKMTVPAPDHLQLLCKTMMNFAQRKWLIKLNLWTNDWFNCAKFCDMWPARHTTHPQSHKAVSFTALTITILCRVCLLLGLKVRCAIHMAWTIFQDPQSWGESSCN